MAADAFIHIRVTSEMKELARVLAAREGVTESKLVKELLERLLRTTALSNPSAALEHIEGKPPYAALRALDPEDHRLLFERSKGSSSAT